MFYSTKIILDGYLELHRRLPNKCRSFCPAYTVRKIGDKYNKCNKRKKLYEKLFCKICTDNFHFIKAGNTKNTCPCYRGANQEEIFLRIDEFIEELQNKLSKEYSS